MADEKKTEHAAIPADWSPSDRALFIVWTAWIGGVTSRVWRERNIEPDPETIAEIDALMVHYVRNLVDAVRGGAIPGPREPHGLVEQFCRHVLVEYFGTPEDRRREFRIVN